MPRTGGQHNLSGVHYQLLLSLLRALEQKAQAVAFGFGGPSRGRLVIRLEPENGGDLQIESYLGLKVEQHKKRSGPKPWSIFEVLRRVLPDLLKAFSDSKFVQSAVLVSDGIPPTWKLFGEQLGLQIEVPPRPLENLDAKMAPDLAAEDSTPIKKAMKKLGLDWSRRDYFRFLCFRLYCEVSGSNGLGSRRRGALSPDTKQQLNRSDTDTCHQKRVWRLLNTFSFERINEFELKAEVEARLFGYLGDGDEVENVADLAVTRLLKLAIKEGSKLDIKELWAHLQLAERDLFDFPRLFEKITEVLKRSVPEGAKPWPNCLESEHSIEMNPIVAAPGRGGEVAQVLDALTWHLLEHKKIPVRVPYNTKPLTTLGDAATQFCQNYWGKARPILFKTIADELKKRGTSIWIVVKGIAATQDLDDFLEQANMDGSYSCAFGVTEGVSLDGGHPAKASFDDIALGGPREGRHFWHVSPLEAVRRDTRTNERPSAEMPEGSTSRPARRQGAAAVYMSPLEFAKSAKRTTGNFVKVPRLRSILLHEVYARVLFREMELKECSSIRSESEYDIVDAWWSSRLQYNGLALTELADLATLDQGDQSYPWPLKFLSRSRWTDDSLRKMLSLGFLKLEVGDREVTFLDTHVAAKAVAEGLFGRWLGHEIDSSQFKKEVMRIAAKNGQRKIRFGASKLIGYLLRLLLGLRIDEAKELFEQLLDGFGEGAHFSYIHGVGADVFVRMVELARNKRQLRRLVADALLKFDDDRLRSTGIELLHESDQELRLCGC